MDIPKVLDLGFVEELVVDEGRERAGVEFDGRGYAELEVVGPERKAIIEGNRSLKDGGTLVLDARAIQFGERLLLVC